MQAYPGFKSLPLRHSFEYDRHSPQVDNRIRTLTSVKGRDCQFDCQYTLDSSKWAIEAAVKAPSIAGQTVDVGSLSAASRTHHRPH